MLKILNGYSWLEEEIGEETLEIKKCLEKGLLKYTDDKDRPQFIALESNIDAVKEILGEDYNKLKEKDFIEWLNYDFGDVYENLKIENNWRDEILIPMNRILTMIEDEESEWFSDDIKLEIYNSEQPNNKVFEYLNDFGREQARMQIQDLLDNIDEQEFK
jgi:hypothetical protein